MRFGYSSVVQPVCRGILVCRRIFFKITRTARCVRFWSWFTIKVCRGSKKVGQHWVIVSNQGRIQRGVLGSNPPLFGFCFQFARVFKKKIPKAPLNFPVHIKKFKTPPSKNVWIHPSLEHTSE